MSPPDRVLRGVIAKAPWGWAYVVWSGQQIVGLELMSTRARAVQQARRRFPGVRAVARTTATDPAAIDCLVLGVLPPHAAVRPHGTHFQHAVWKAIRDIPAGRTRSYREIAEDVGRPKAVRAVARACAANPVALLIPCHRVIASDGSLGGYRWGVRRKRALLRAEASSSGRDVPPGASIERASRPRHTPHTAPAASTVHRRPPRYWLVKSEPHVFSFDDLTTAPAETTSWTGVRNFTARNYLRDMQLGDLVFFYHSNATPSAIVGIARVVRESYPDLTAHDPANAYYDPRSTPRTPRWLTVDLAAVMALPFPSRSQTSRPIRRGSNPT